jgi:hypothetical protein
VEALTPFSAAFSGVFIERLHEAEALTPLSAAFSGVSIERLREVEALTPIHQYIDLFPKNCKGRKYHKNEGKTAILWFGC